MSSNLVSNYTVRVVGVDSVCSTHAPKTAKEEKTRTYLLEHGRKNI